MTKMNCSATFSLTHFYNISFPSARDHAIVVYLQILFRVWIKNNNVSACNAVFHF